MKPILGIVCCLIILSVPFKTYAGDGVISAGPILGLPLGIGLVVEATPKAAFRIQGTVGTILMVNSVGLRGLLFPPMLGHGYLFGGGGRYLFVTPDVIGYRNYYWVGVGARNDHRSGASFFEVGYATETETNTGLMTISVGFLVGGH
jgi:hypothetical protein